MPTREMRPAALKNYRKRQMPMYNIVHFQNPDPLQETKFADWQRRELTPIVLEIPGVQAIRHFNLQPVQLQPGNIQPWRFATIYELEIERTAEILPQIAHHARAVPKEMGLLQEDVAHMFELTRPFIASPNPPDPTVPFHVAFVMGNCVPGKEMEYDNWYDNVHSGEVLGTPGFIGMRRGMVCAEQLDPTDEQPANRLVLLMLRAPDLYAAIEEFIDRAYSRSKSGIAWAPRENAAAFASLKRTTHVFSPYTPRLTKISAHAGAPGPALLAQV
jgi:hypothetical protein